MGKRTPLYETHVAAGAKMIEFGGWDMPVQYSGVLEEHRAVRNQAGVFDLSHMGEFFISGPDALPALNAITTNDLAKLAVGHAQYALLCLPTGGIVDDVIIYRWPTGYYMVVNAANISKDAAWITSHLQGQVTFSNLSADTALIAVQGPLAEQITRDVVPCNITNLCAFEFALCTVDGAEVMVSRTGYTGEDGFELYLPTNMAHAIWERVRQVGTPLGLVPVGLGARDTLRLEARLTLYGNDIDENSTPLEAGLGYFVRFDKGEFIGRSSLLAQKDQGVGRKLVAFVVEGRGIPRHGYPLMAADGTTIGTVTSGSFSPTLAKDIGLGYVSVQYAEPGTRIYVDVRGKAKPADVIKGRFVAAHTRRR